MKKTQLRREETEWANKSKQNYLKTHIYTLPPSFLPSFVLSFLPDRKKLQTLEFLSTLISPSFNSSSQLVSPLWCFIHEKPSCVISTYLFGCLGSNPYLCPFLSLKCTFSPWDFWRSPPNISFPFHKFPFYPKLLSIEQSNTVVLSILTRANCDQLIPFPFSAKNTFHDFTPLHFYWEVTPPATKSPHKKLYIKVASQEEFCCAKQRLFGFCHESQTSRIIPTTTPPLRFTVMSR